jgi:hypothetical protein
MRYILLICTEEAGFEAMSPEERSAMDAEYGASCRAANGCG